ncbi:unnamed protein product [Soboliphyme baturini]|uniref:Mediator of RNA polymerase II transcription subunit 1 n=1 Tax=Soboliphyme baturini TaxID=241478 RepID=A0A183IHY1_9BILA|nr:unnamed protein product [Soboliphyme baturini]
MEHLRQKSSAIPSWSEIIKRAKTNMMEKRNPLDVEERKQISKCISLLMENIKINSVSELFEQLEDISSKTSLTFMRSPSASTSSFITSDCFFIEIVADEVGKAVRVCITFGQQAAEESDALLNVINSCNWPELEKHLNGLKMAYINTRDRTLKSQAFSFVQNVEKQLSALTTPRCDIENLPEYLLTSDYGYFQPRNAGIAGRLYFFVHPYDLLDVQNNSVRRTVSLSDLSKLKIGTYAELLLSNCDQSEKLVNGFMMDDLNFALESMCHGSTMDVCATFVFRFPAGLLVTTESVERFSTSQFSNRITYGPDFAKEKLRVQFRHESCFVYCYKLPGQNHCYWINIRGGVEAVDITELRFLNTNLIPQIINILRANVLLTSVFASSVRNVKQGAALQQDVVNDQGLCYIHIDCHDTSTIECVLENLKDGSFVSVKFDLSDFRAFNVLVSSLSGSMLSFPVDDVEKVFAKCWSIPVTMRSLILKMTDIPKEEIKNFYKTPPAAPVVCSTDSWNDVSDQSDSVLLRSAYNNKQNFSSYLPVKEMLPCSGKAACDKRHRDHHFQSNLLNLTEFSWRAPGSNNRRPSNLLDLFKEIEVWHELIPPRQCQVMKKQFTTGQPHVRNSFHANATQPPQLPVSAPLGVVCSVSNNKGSSKARHMNSTSEALTELDELCQLSSSLTDSAHAVFDDSHGSSHAQGDTPTAVEAKSVVTSFVDSNKSSIQDAIDSVVGSVNSSPRNSIDVFDFEASASTFDLGAGLDIHHHWSSQTDGRASLSGHLHSVSTSGRVNEELDASSWAEQRNALALRGILGTRGGSIRRRRARKSMGNVADHTMELVMKGMRKAERMVRGTGGQRRPRKARVLSADNIRNVAMNPGSSGSGAGGAPFLSRKLPLKLCQQQQGIPMTTGGDDTLDASGYELQLCTVPSVFGMHDGRGFHAVSSGARGEDSATTVTTSNQQRLESCLESDGSDASERFKDETLRKQMQAVVRAVFSDVKLTSFADTETDVLSSSTPSSSFSGTEKNYCSTSGNVSSDYGSFDSSKGGSNVFHDSATNDIGSLMVSASMGFAGSGSSKLHKRKNSLDAVIGKLMDKVGTGTIDSYTEQSADESMMDASAEQDVYELTSAAKRFKEDDTGGNGQGGTSSSSSSARFLSEMVSGEKKEPVSLVKALAESGSGENVEISERIKLVIKKSSIIKLPSSKSSSSSSAKQQRAENKANMLSLKRSSPPLTFSSLASAQVSLPMKSLSDKDPVLLLEKLQTGNKLDVLKHKIQDKKLRKQVSVHGEQPTRQRVRSSSAVSKTEKAAAKQQKQAEVAAERKSSEKASQKPSSNAGTTSASGPGSNDLPRVFSGSEGILFSKSLKGFKIPKIEDSSKAGQSSGGGGGAVSSASNLSVGGGTCSLLPPSQSVAQQQQTEPVGGAAKPIVDTQASEECVAKSTLSHSNPNSEQSKSPARKVFSSQQTTAKVPKSILKHVPTPPLQPQSVGALGIFPPQNDYPASTSFRPYARKTLLPDPPAQNKILTTDQKNQCVTHQRPVLLGFNASSSLEQGPPMTRPLAQTVLTQQTSSPISVSPPDIIPSPESNGLVIDDTPKSPCGIQTCAKEGDPAYKSVQQKCPAYVAGDLPSQAATTAASAVTDNKVEGDK